MTVYHIKKNWRGKGEPMASDDPGVWIRLYTELPILVRFTLSVLSLGLLSLLVWAYRRERASTERIETQLHARMDRLEDHFDRRVNGVEQGLNQRLEEMNGHLIDIAKNTSRGG